MRRKRAWTSSGAEEEGDARGKRLGRVDALVHALVLALREGVNDRQVGNVVLCCHVLLVVDVDAREGDVERVQRVSRLSVREQRCGKEHHDQVSESGL